jgi:8-oxo-dGTP pyrophosphatase MutT (NUDIX family)
MRNSIDVTVAAIAENQGRFLLVEEQVGNSIVFNQPAGHLEAGESVLDAVVRETREETGLKFDPEFLVGIYSWRCAEGTSFLRLCFAGKCDAVPLSDTLDDGIIAAHWLTHDELLTTGRQLRSPMVLEAIDDFLAGQRCPLDILRHLRPEEAPITRRA